MKIKKFCELCKHEIVDKIICDTCGKELKSELIFKLSFIYTEEIIEKLEGDDYDFCSLKCLFRFVIEELKKLKKEDRFEYGQDIDSQKGEEKQ